MRRSKPYTRPSGSLTPETRATPHIRLLRLVPGQALARATTEVAERPTARGCSTTLRWTPAHKGVEGNKVADDYAKEAAESLWDATDRRHRWEASLSHPARKNAEARSQATRDWIAGHVKNRRRSQPPRGSSICPALKGTKGADWTVLPAPFGTRCDRGLSGRQDQKDSQTSAGGLTAERGRRAITSPSDAEPGNPRAERCGRASGRHVGGSTRGLLPP